MLKNKVFAVFAAFILVFNLNNVSLAIESAKITKSKYPDYSYLFAGRDKFENFNRKIYIFNSKANKYVLRPVNTVWASVMPKYGMDRIQNMTTNVEYPIRFVSCLFQRDFKSARKETSRFFINTTIGFAGMFDPAKNRFNIEPVQEDMGQALAHCKRIKKGPYLVVPIVASGNIRDLGGKLLDCAFNPTTYAFLGPIASIAKSVLVLNRTTYMQPLAKNIDTTYADPYDVTKKLQCVEREIKNSNLDRKEVLKQREAAQNIIEVNQVVPVEGLKADITLNGYNPQSPLIDAMRTALFDNKEITESAWSELSVWNRSFSKRIRTSSVSIYPNHAKYSYRYILQKNKNAPLAIIYPSIGENIRSHHSVVIAKMFYDEGYSVLMQGSPFQWEFVKSMPEGYRPGLPDNDANYSRIVTAKIINDLQTKKECKFGKKVMVGTSFGAITTLFAAAQEEKDNKLGISKYISINPPIEILFAMKQFDKYSQDWQSDPADIKSRIALTAAKVIQKAQDISDEKKEEKQTPSNKRFFFPADKVKKEQNKTNDKEIKVANTPKTQTMPFTEDEAKLIMSFVMKQKLNDIVFTIEKCPTSKKSAQQQEINDMSFSDYAKKYLTLSDSNYEKFNYEGSLFSISDFLQKSDKYKIYHTLDDYYVNPEQLIRLKQTCGSKSVYFNNGSHLGFLYRKEFQDEFKKDIKLENSIPITPVPVKKL